MFRNLHIQLTAVCTLCTAMIMIVVTCFCVSIFESGMKEKEYGVFLTDVNALFTHIQNEEVITMEWFQRSRMNGRYILSVEDNGQELSLVSLVISAAEREVIEQAQYLAREEYNLDTSGFRTAKSIHKQVEFTFQDKDKQEYYAALVYIPRENGYMSMTCIYSLHNFWQDLYRQRIVFGSLVFLAVICLGVFSYIFTGKVLKPVEQNRERQTAFISAASHELRSPLTVIRASLTAAKKADEKRARRFEEIVQMELERMSRLVGDMLALSRADASSWGMMYEEEDLQEIIENVVDKYQSLGKEKEIQILFLREHGKDYKCWCDRGRLEQVLTILLDNGISHIPAGSRISIGVENRRKKWRIHVQDNGPGIEDIYKEKIFERFYRIDTSHNSKEHFGLGLSIAREIMRLHKGKLYVVDAPGGGSCFVIQFSR